MDEAVYLRGRNNPKEGGPKGIDIDAGMDIMATTCECQPLAFFDLQAILAKAGADLRRRRLHPGIADEQDALAVSLELDVLRQTNVFRERAARAEAKAAAADERAARAEAEAAAAEKRAGRAEASAEKARTRAEKAKAKAARAKARAGFVINGRPWPITAPLRRLYSALRRPN
jgi:hypothetical protein